VAFAPSPLSTQRFEIALSDMPIASVITAAASQRVLRRRRNGPGDGRADGRGGGALCWRLRRRRREGMANKV
jgi:hypothetical protein